MAFSKEKNIIGTMKNTNLTKVTLILSSLLLLSSCGDDYGEELSSDDEKVAVLYASIANEMKKTTNYEFKVKEDIASKYQQKFGQTISNLKVEETLLVNEKNEMKATYSSSWDGGNQTITAYISSDGTTTYGQSSGKVNGSDFSHAGYAIEENGREFSDVFRGLFSFYVTFSDPFECLGDLTKPLFFSTIGITASNTCSIHSKGEGNLTFVISKSVEKREAYAMDNIVMEKDVITYDNYLFKSARIEQEDDKGSKNIYDITFSKKDPFTIDFPEAMKNSEA